MKLIISARALAEFEHEVDYLIERNPAAAIEFHDTVLEAFERLMVFPTAGAPTTYPQLRRLVLTKFPHLIYYRATDDAIEIVSVFAGARNPDKAPKK